MNIPHFGPDFRLGPKILSNFGFFAFFFGKQFAIFMQNGENFLEVIFSKSPAGSLQPEGAPKGFHMELAFFLHLF